MNFWCRLLGHDWENLSTSGIRVDLKRVHRRVKYCNRCGERIQTDTITGEVDMKEGYYCWGSAGPCYGCANKETCPEVPYKQGMVGGAFAWSKCPISNFKLKEGFEKYFQGDTIIA